MYRRQPRSDRRSNDGLYQAENHRKIMARRAEQRARRRPCLTSEELEQRAIEANRHDSDYVHLFPDTLLDLLHIQRRLALIEEILELHWEMAQRDPEAHEKRDSMLWAQTIRKFRRRQE